MKSMKISDKTVDDLQTLIHHARVDIDFGEGGSYNRDPGSGVDWPFDKIDAKKSQRAMEFIRKLIESRKK